MNIVFDSRLNWDATTEEYHFPAIVNHQLIQCAVTKNAMVVALEVPSEEVKYSESFKNHRGVIRAVARRLIESGRQEEGRIVIRETDFE